jgi:hypothetical protein
MLEGRGQDGQQHARRDQRSNDDNELVLERAGTLDLAVLLGAIRRPLQRGPGNRSDQQRRQQTEGRIEIDIGSLRRVDRRLVEVRRSARGGDKSVKFLREGLWRGAEEQVQHEAK